jgi:hypothetical protein
MTKILYLFETFSSGGMEHMFVKSEMRKFLVGLKPVLLTFVMTNELSSDDIRYKNDHTGGCIAASPPATRE